MTELFIDGTSVVLSAEFATEFKRENPFITKNGEYTYDIKLSMKHPVNQALYAPYLRVNAKNRVQNKRQAILVVNNMVIMKGTEIINGWDEDSVSIQLASGNSELNYLIGADLRIDSLDLGKVVLPEGSSMMDYCNETLNHTYPERDVVACPVYDQTTLVAYNDVVIQEKTVGDKHCVINTNSELVLQPYLCAVINKILTALDYGLGFNCLAESFYKQLVLLTNAKTMEFAKMVPMWTVKDFFENLENLLNICLMVNNRTHKVDIYFRNQFYNEKGHEIYLEVEDDFDVEVDEDADPDASVANMVYVLPDTPYYHFTKLNKQLMDGAERVTKSGVGEVNNYMKINKPPRTIVTDSVTGRQYIYAPDVNSDVCIKEVNQYEDLDRKDKDLEIRIVPAAVYRKYLLDGRKTDNEHLPEEIEWPYSTFSGQKVEEQEKVDDLSINEIVNQQKSLEKKEAENKFLFLTFWHGKVTHAGSKPMPCPVPLAIPDSIVQHTGQLPKVIVDNKFSLRWCILDRELYNGVYKIDRKTNYTFYSNDPNMPDSRGIFIIRNRRFVCKEMRWTIARGEVNKKWCITCNPVAMNDTNFYQRWVLEDGTWAGGGVWLADGRWKTK